jgi:type VI secretion system secreted protein VgrG
MKAKSGKVIKPVKPIAPSETLEADEADPGVVEKVKAEEIEKKSGKYGSVPAKPFKPAGGGGGGGSSSSSSSDSSSEEKPTTWIEIEMVDEADEPIAGERYEVTLPDGSVAKGTLDGNGFARIEGIDPPGECQISWPDLDKDAWKKA